MIGLAIVVTSSLFTGCATTKAAAAVAGPPLAVPEAPQRVIVPAEEEPLASTSTGLDRPLAAVPQVQAPSPAQPRRSNVPRADTDSRNEPASPAAATAVASANVESPRDARPLPAAEVTYQQRVSAYLTKASNDLKCVEYAKLSNERKAIFNESKRHSDAAAEKMKERNWNFALSAAEKAAAFAADLATTCTNR